jgi:tetratricopeptide (TPR) repeat protein
MVTFQFPSVTEQSEKTNPSLPSRRSKGLVSSRVQMFEQSRNSSRPPKPVPMPYRSRTFKDIPPDNEAVDSRQDSGKPDTKVALSGYLGSGLVKTGVDHYNKGEFEQASKAFSTALKTQRVSFGDDHLCIGLTLGNLGAVHLQQGNVDEAERMLEESLATKQRHAPNMVLSDTLNNLGSCASLRGDYEKSLYYYKRALTDLKDKDGAVVDVASALFNIGRVEIQLRQWDDALRDLETACTLTRESYGVHHAFVAQTLDLIGYVHLCTSNLDNAMVSFAGALAIYRRLHGPINLEVANSLLNIGMVRESKDELTDAWDAYSTAHDLFVRLKVSQDHPGFAATRRSIAKVTEAIARKNQKSLVEKHKKAQALANSRV